MKIAILTTSFLPKIGGAQVFTYNIGRSLQAAGNHVDVYVTRDNYQALEPEYRTFLKPLPWKFYGFVRNLPRIGIPLAHNFLTNAQTLRQYDVWLVIGTYPGGYVGSCLEGMVPIVLRGSGEDIQKSTHLNYGFRLNSTIERKIVNTVGSYDKLVALTDSVKIDFLDMGASPADVEIIPNGVDLDWFKGKLTKSDVRNRLGWPLDKRIILTTGRNHPKKGYSLIPPIAQELKKERIPFHWYVVGLGANRIKDQIEGLGLSSEISTCPEVGLDHSDTGHWKFPQRRLVDMYNAADIYAFPSMLETFGMVQLEAMAAGTAVVSTDAPGCRDVIVPNYNGLQAQAGSVKSFTDQLRRLLLDDALRNRISMGGLEFVTEYSWEKVTNRYMDLFNSLIRMNDSN